MINIKKNEIVELFNQKEYFIAEKVVINNKNYCIAIGVTEDYNVDTEDIIYFEEVIEDGNTFIDIIEDDDLEEQILKEVIKEKPIEETPELLDLVDKLSKASKKR